MHALFLRNYGKVYLHSSVDKTKSNFVVFNKLLKDDDCCVGLSLEGIFLCRTSHLALTIHR